VLDVSLFCVETREDNWDMMNTFFAYLPDVRKIICAAKAILMTMPSWNPSMEDDKESLFRMPTMTVLNKLDKIIQLY
jgi:transposase-like protein